MHFFRFSILLLMVLVFTSSQAQARTCYSKYEKEAEQGLRIHSELMVIGLTCLKAKGGKDLYHRYQLFTAKHAPLLEGYENTLINFYRRGGHAKPEKSLHKLRTDLGNEISHHAVRMGTTNFCNHFSGRIDQALEMPRKKLRRWAQQDWNKQKNTHSVCFAER